MKVFNRKRKKELKPNYYPNLIDDNIGFTGIFAAESKHPFIRKEESLIFFEEKKENINEIIDIEEEKNWNELLENIEVLYGMIGERKKIRELLINGQFNDEEFGERKRELSKISQNIETMFSKKIKIDRFKLKKDRSIKILENIIETIQQILVVNDNETLKLLDYKKKEASETSSAVQLAYKEEELKKLNQEINTFKAYAESEAQKYEDLLNDYSKEKNLRELETQDKNILQKEFDKAKQDLKEIGEVKKSMKEDIIRLKQEVISEKTNLELQLKQQKANNEEQIANLQKQFEEKKNSLLEVIEALERKNDDSNKYLEEINTYKIRVDVITADFKKSLAEMVEEKNKYIKIYEKYKIAYTQYVSLCGLLNISTEQIDEKLEENSELLKEQYIALNEKIKELTYIANEKTNNMKILEEQISYQKIEIFNLSEKLVANMNTIENLEKQIKLNLIKIKDYEVLVNELFRNLLNRVLEKLNSTAYTIKSIKAKELFIINDNKINLIEDKLELLNMGEKLALATEILQEFKFSTDVSDVYAELSSRVDFLKQQINNNYNEQTKYTVILSEIRTHVHETTKYISDLQQTYSKNADVQAIFNGNNVIYEKLGVLLQIIRQSLDVNNYMADNSSAIKFLKFDFNKLNEPYFLSFSQLCQLFKLYNPTAEPLYNSTNYITSALELMQIKTKIVYKNTFTYLGLGDSGDNIKDIDTLIGAIYACGNIRRTKTKKADSYEFCHDPIYYIFAQFISKMKLTEQLFDYALICKIVNYVICDNIKESKESIPFSTPFSYISDLKAYIIANYLPDVEEAKKVFFATSNRLEQSVENGAILFALGIWLQHVAHIFKILRFVKLYIKEQCDFLALELLCKHFRFYVGSEEPLILFYLFKKLIFNLFASLSRENVNEEIQKNLYKYQELAKKLLISQLSFIDQKKGLAITSNINVFLDSIKRVDIGSKEWKSQIYTNHSLFPKGNLISDDIKTNSISIVYTPILPISMKPESLYDKTIRDVLLEKFTTKESLLHFQDVIEGRNVGLIQNTGMIFANDKIVFSQNIAFLINAAFYYSVIGPYSYANFAIVQEIDELEDYGFSLFILKSLLETPQIIEIKSKINDTSIKENENAKSSQIYVSYLDANLLDRIRNSIYKAPQIDYSMPAIPLFSQSPLDRSLLNPKQKELLKRQAYPDLGNRPAVEDQSWFKSINKARILPVKKQWTLQDESSDEDPMKKK